MRRSAISLIFWVSWVLAAVAGKEPPSTFPSFGSYEALDKYIQDTLNPYQTLPQRQQFLVDADKAFQSFLKISPADAGLRNAYGAFLWNYVDESKAIDQWRIAAKLAPADPETNAYLAEAALRNGDAREAAACFRRALTAQPDNAEYHFGLANVVLVFRKELAPKADQALIPEALHHFKRAAELAPGNASYAQAYAETFYVLPAPDWAAAREAWEKVRALSADQEFANHHLARICLYLGKKEDALAYLEQIPQPRRDQITRRLLAPAAPAPSPSTAGPVVKTNAKEAAPGVDPR